MYLEHRNFFIHYPSLSFLGSHTVFFTILILSIFLKFSTLTILLVKLFISSLKHFLIFSPYYSCFHKLSSLHILMSFVVFMVFSFLLCLYWIVNYLKAFPFTYYVSLITNCVVFNVFLYLLIYVLIFNVKLII